MRLRIVSDFAADRPFAVVDVAADVVIARHLSLADAAWHVGFLEELREADDNGDDEEVIDYCEHCGDLFAAGDVDDAGLCGVCADDDPDDPDDDDPDDEDSPTSWRELSWTN